MSPQTSWANSFYLILCFPEETQAISDEWKKWRNNIWKRVGWTLRDGNELEVGYQSDSNCWGSCFATSWGHLRSPSVRKKTISTLRDQLRNTQLEPFLKLCSITFPHCGHFLPLEIGFQISQAQADDLEFLSLLAPPLQCWDYWCTTTA